MKILYTNQGKEVYLDDDIADKIASKTLVETNKNSGVSVIIGGNPIALGKFIINKEGVKRVKRIDSTNFNYQRENLTCKSKLATGIFDNIPYVGVVPTRVRNITYAMSYYYEDGKRTYLGYFYTPYDAAIVREYTIRKDNINTKPTNISLTDEELYREYKRILDNTDKAKQENEKTRSNKFRDMLKQKQLENDRHGIHEKDNTFTVKLRVNGKIKKIGTYQVLEEAIIMRNCYVINNKLDCHICPLDITLEEQMRRSLNIKTTQQIRELNSDTKRKPKSGYKGINTIKEANGERYQVLVRNGKIVRYVGNSRDKDMAAMMYNIYVIENGLSEEIINDVGISLAEQKHILRLDGYEFNGERFSKQIKRKY